MDLKQMLERRAKVWDDMQSLRDSAQQGKRDLTAVEQRTWAAMESELEDLTGRIEAEQKVSAHVREHGLSDTVDWHAGDGSGVVTRTGGAMRRNQPLQRTQSVADWARRYDHTVRADEPELNLGTYLRGMVTGQWDRDSEAERRAMAEGAGASGGYAVPTILSSKLIDLARNQSRVFQAGAQTVPMETGTVNLAKWVSDPAPAWRAENTLIPSSDASLAQVQLVAKTLAVVTQVSLELIEDSPAGHDISNELANGIAEAFALKLDLAALYGAGTSVEPRGLANTAGINTQSMGTNGALPTNWDFLVDAVGGLQDNNEQVSGIIYAPRTDRELAKLKDSQNRYLDPPTILRDVPRLPTNQVPVTRTQGTSSTASDIFVGDFSQLIIGLRTQFTLTPLTERYADYGQVGFLGWLRADVAVARPKAFTMVSGVL